MASKSKKTLNKENLMLLDIEQLADLLMEISKGNAVSQRILRTALAGALGVDEASKEIRKRINAISRAKTYINYAKRKAFIKDLEALKNQILKQILPKHPEDGLDLMWCLLRLSNGILGRAHDESETFHNFFFSLTQDLATCAMRAKEKPYILAERIFNDIFDNDYGQYDHLIAHMTEALGTEGLTLLKEKLHTEQTDRDKTYIMQSALENIAEGLNDVDSYIALQSKDALKIPQLASNVAMKLLNVGRIQEAWSAIENADCHRFRHQLDAWANARIAILEAQKKHDEAQSFRYDWFQKYLSAEMLKDYLKKLPEFQDFKAEQAALEFVASHDNVNHALYFLTQWHAPKHLNEMILKRHGEIDGNGYEMLSHTAKTLAAEYPLSATIILRGLINHTLDHAKSKRYKYTAKHLKECIALSQYIPDYQHHMSHIEYMKILKTKHGKKYSFWHLL
ncbi:MAG: hypothetical protein ACJAQ0_001184 [Dasania sp.]|jgi:hypothetical protein